MTLFLVSGILAGATQDASQASELVGVNGAFSIILAVPAVRARRAGS